jgi:hypothetical protein
MCGDGPETNSMFGSTVTKRWSWEMNVDQNGWQDVPEEEREALARWEETQGDYAGIVVPDASSDKPVACPSRDTWSRAPATTHSAAECLCESSL